MGILKQNGYLAKTKMNFGWMRKFVKVGSISGLESFARNLAYMLMISRMVNMVGEQGTYWVANNFIWGWLLLPITQLGELIKQETALKPRKDRKATLTYFCLTGGICIVWLLALPLYQPFMRIILGYEDTAKLFQLVLILLPFYILYAFQNIFDSVFYGAGKTNYMLFESVVTNTVFYGIAFATYLFGFWTPSLFGIALLFGLGNAFDTGVSWLAYMHYKKHLKSKSF
jgi:Na+-driven multidrug efflux pump